MTGGPCWTDEAVAALLFIFRTCRTVEMDPMGRPLRVRGWEFIHKMLKVLGHDHSLFATQTKASVLKKASDDEFKVWKVMADSNLDNYYELLMHYVRTGKAKNQPQLQAKSQAESQVGSQAAPAKEIIKGDD
ncbi:hypothetical protein F5X96DRAFT_669468 [Biscogniauxia mediterranea]|nr:hypothetical protein F5X96DRAFT_669468 [Biscogniauxia mediterranea]